MSFNLLTTAHGSSSRRRTPTSAETRRAGLYRNLFLWVLQTWLALFYIGSGYAKLSQSQAMLAVLMTWPAQVDVSLLHAIGWMEIGLAACVVTPLISWWAFRPVLLTGALGLLIDAGLMAGFHALERDGFLAVVNVLLVLMALTVIVGRWTWRTPNDGASSHVR